MKMIRNAVSALTLTLLLPLGLTAGVGITTIEAPSMASYRDERMTAVPD